MHKKHTKQAEAKNNAWQLAEQFFGGMLPFSDMEKISGLLKDSSWLDQLIEETLQQAMPTNSAQSAKSMHAQSADKRYDYVDTKDIMETHRSLIIQMKLPDKFNPRLLRLYVSPLSVRVEGLPDGAKRSIELPREIQMVGIRSSYKDNVLEIRLPKRRITEQERQITIDIE